MAGELVKQAVAHYHALLEQSYLSDTAERLNRAIEAHKLTVAGRSVCNVLRPQFLDSASYAMVRQASTLVMQGFAELAERLLADASLRSTVGLSRDEEELVLIETGYGAPDVSARLDGFLDANGGFRFVEYNADSPGGIAFGDALSEVFAGLPIVQEFARRYPFSIMPARSFTFDALVGAYHRWGGRGIPSMAIVDWRTAVTRNEFLLMQEHFEARGCPVKIVDPEELDYSGGNLYATGARVDFVYKRLVTFELLQRLGLNHPLVRAVRERAVCMANGFAVQMLFQKSLFALLNDPAFFQPKNAEVAQAIQKHVPWSRLVRDCKTQYNGQSIDLLPFIESNQNRLVLKPCSEYGGKGVSLGWECSDAQWKVAMKDAAASPHIVQERVTLGEEVYPTFVDGKLAFTQRYFDLDPYVWNGRHIEGCGVRLSSVALLNVSAGGGSATPLFVI